MMKPRMDYTRSYCLFDCQRCSEVCPDGALTPLTLALKHGAKIGVAKLDLDRCIVKTKGTDCAACSEHCPTKAVDTKPYGDNLRIPWVHGESCIGCGACEYACPAEPKAIRVTGHQQHKFIRERPAEKAQAPTQSGDFPF
jgi:NAD-dependent dihydropyrimidine dehydrogenase PreA subunit